MHANVKGRKEKQQELFRPCFCFGFNENCKVICIIGKKEKSVSNAIVNMVIKFMSCSFKREWRYSISTNPRVLSKMSVVRLGAYSTVKLNVQEIWRWPRSLHKTNDMLWL